MVDADTPPVDYLAAPPADLPTELAAPCAARWPTMDRAERGAIHRLAAERRAIDRGLHVAVFAADIRAAQERAQGGR
jgi:hypothetical protein